MIEQIANPITFAVFYVASKVGKAGLAVTVDVYRGNAQIITAAAAADVGGGIYSYTLAAASVTSESNYYAIFRTGDSGVDQQDIPALWTVGVAGVENLDAAVSSRSTYAGGAVASVTAPVTVGANNDKTGYSATATNFAAAPTAAQVRAEMDANSTRLANLDATVSSRSTYAGADTPGTTTLLGRIAAALAITGGKVDVNDKTGFSGTATNYAAAPTPAQIAAAILATPANLLATNASGQVTTANPAMGGSTVTEATIWGYGARSLTDKTGYSATATNFAAAPTASAIRAEMDANSTRLANLDAAVSSRSTYAGADTAGTTTLLSRLTAARAGYLDTLNGLVAAIWAYATRTLSTFGFSVAASNLPADYQQRGVAVTLPANAPAGYGGGGGGAGLSAGTVAALEAADQILLAAPYTPTPAPVLVIPQPADDPTLCVVYAYLETPQGAPAASVTVAFTLAAPAGLRDANGKLISGRTVKATSNTAGYLQVILERNDRLQPAESTWTVTSSALGWQHAKSFELNAETFDLGSIV